MLSESRQLRERQGFISHKFKCRACDELFTTSNKLRQHEASCRDKTELKFPGKFHVNTDDVFRNLSALDIETKCDEQYFDYFITYDFESLLIKKSSETEPGKLKWISEHVPISVSISSNVPGYTDAKCIVNSDRALLINGMLDYMMEISEKSGSSMRKKFARQIAKLYNLREKNCSGAVLMNDDFVKRTQGMLYGFCNQIPVVGYNSSRYDLHLIMSDLIAQIGVRVKNFMSEYEALSLRYKGTRGKSAKQEEKAAKQEIDEKIRKNHIHDIIKKGSSYTCVSMTTLKFLDILNFLAQGSNYDCFLKAWGCSMHKSFFPYEWFDSRECLQYPKLPPYDSFYSSLKQENVLEKEYRNFMDILNTGKSKEKALLILKLKAEPPTGRENYKLCTKSGMINKWLHSKTS